MQLYIHKGYLEFLYYFFLQDIKHILLKVRHFLFVMSCSEEFQGISFFYN